MPPSSSILHRAFTGKLVSLAKAYRHHVNEQLERHMLSPGAAVGAMLLGRIDGECNQKYLAEQLDIAAPSLVPLLNQMEASGLILRSTDPEDKRVNKIALTTKGRRLGEKTEQVAEEIRIDLFPDISNDDLRAALRVFDALRAALTTQKKST